MSVCVEMDSQRPAVTQAGNWTTTPVNASVKVKERGSGAPMAKGGMRNCAVVCVTRPVPETTP